MANFSGMTERIKQSLRAAPKSSFRIVCFEDAHTKQKRRRLAKRSQRLGDHCYTEGRIQYNRASTLWLQHYHSKLKQDYRRQITAVHANGIEVDAATEDETDVTPARSIESGMIPIESVLQIVRDTTNGVATTSQQTDIIQRIRKAYSVRNAWHDESTNVLQAI